MVTRITEIEPRNLEWSVAQHRELRFGRILFVAVMLAPFIAWIVAHRAPELIKEHDVIATMAVAMWGASLRHCFLPFQVNRKNRIGYYLYIVVVDAWADKFRFYLVPANMTGDDWKHRNASRGEPDISISLCSEHSSSVKGFRDDYGPWRISSLRVKGNADPKENISLMLRDDHGGRVQITLSELARLLPALDGAGRLGKLFYTSIAQLKHHLPKEQTEKLSSVPLN
jgi:hypothetical protein